MSVNMSIVRIIYLTANISMDKIRIKLLTFYRSYDKLPDVYAWTELRQHDQQIQGISPSQINQIMCISARAHDEPCVFCVIDFMCDVYGYAGC